MKREEVFIILNKIFCEVFDDDNIKLTDLTTSDDIEDWDSLEQINLVVACEKEFNIKFDLHISLLSIIIDTIIKERWRNG